MSLMLENYKNVRVRAQSSVISFQILPVDGKIGSGKTPMERISFNAAFI